MQVIKLCDLRAHADSVTSVSWIGKGQHLAVGTTNGLVLLWDTVKCKTIRAMTGHAARIGTMASKASLLLTGSRDRSILYRDIRAPEQFLGTLLGHKQEVCGVRWSPDRPLIASGGNDNKLYVWDINNFRTGPCIQFNEHKAAVKALAWSPHQVMSASP
ncbi:hypothetical protein Zmor_012102 [Zophobas morio]|uniref:Uncharacterized protein n=1 Tax=Zophobas morio TaxID=2755281 RepID=A0AA38HGH1_9CUCU|nr:hypothetical protein Zmor_012102 [Zophobas morio]